jgi:hypothetical protein
MRLRIAREIRPGGPNVRANARRGAPVITVTHHGRVERLAGKGTEVIIPILIASDPEVSPRFSCKYTDLIEQLCAGMS